MWSKASEKSDELVVGSIPPGLSVERRDLVENSLLHLKVGVQIDLRGLDRLMTEPQRNHGPINTLLQEIHGGGVAKHMRAHALMLERWADGGRRRDVLGQQVVHAVRAQTTAACVWEYGLIWAFEWFFHPGSEDGPSVLA